MPKVLIKRSVPGLGMLYTQYFYNADAYFRFVESCARLGVTLPIVPGIMPVTNFERLGTCDRPSHPVAASPISRRNKQAWNRSSILSHPRN